MFHRSLSTMALRWISAALRLNIASGPDALLSGAARRHIPTYIHTHKRHRDQVLDADSTGPTVPMPGELIMHAVTCVE